jgi:hypothetical protein
MSHTSATAYVRNGRLCIVGLHEDDATGPVPFTHTVELPEGVEDGPVVIGAEDQEPAITTAIEKARQPMLSKIEESKMRMTAEQWVERARAGDQNAMALIQGVRRGALRGVERAKRAARLLAEYIHSHPVDMEQNHTRYLPAHVEPSTNMTVAKKLSQFVGDEAAIGAWSPTIAKSDPYLAVLILASGPNMSPERVKAIAAHFGADQRAFWNGFNARNECMVGRNQLDAYHAGKAVSGARTLQGVRVGAFPISRFCRVAGWEMGE